MIANVRKRYKNTAFYEYALYAVSSTSLIFSIYQSLSDFILEAMHWDDFKIDRKNCLRDSNKNKRIRIHCDYGLLRMV